MQLTLQNTPGAFTLVYPNQVSPFASQYPFFYHDSRNDFFVIPEKKYHRIKISGNTTLMDPRDLIDLKDLHDNIDIIAGGQPWKNPIEDILDDDFIDPRVMNEKWDWHNVDINLSQHKNLGPQTNTVILPYESTMQGEQSIVIDTSNVPEILNEANDKGIYVGKWNQHYRFYTFRHPYVWEFTKRLNRKGIDGLLQRNVQFLTGDYFREQYDPKVNVVLQEYPKHQVEFNYNGAYSLYNWELFFHTPLLIANRLMQNQQFADAQKWFHYIFNPTDTSEESAPERYWGFKPFYEESKGQSIQELMQILNYDGSDEALLQMKEDIEAQVLEWRKKPFEPHVIAQLRISAYQKMVVMKYLDNLIAWGDQLFSQDTIESINEATQLYILAADILGERPKEVPNSSTQSMMNFKQLEKKLDEFGNAAVEIENHLSDSVVYHPSGMDAPPFHLDTLYFCIPKNDQLLGYWDTLEDRMFKIRHCMNIKGLTRQLPMFEPPIDPAMLVRAAAAGVDIGSAVRDADTVLPHYRFKALMFKAIEFCKEVTTLGSTLLQVLEKQDAEELSVLRSGHEVNLQEAMKLVKEKQVDEAKESLEGLQKAMEITQHRFEYYKNREYMNSYEKEQLEKLKSAQNKQNEAMNYDNLAKLATLLPNVTLGTAGMSSPVIHGTYGGIDVSNGLTAYATYLRMKANEESYKANKNSLMGRYEQRADEWKLQERIAEKELEQLEKQILAAEIRLEMMEHELNNHQMKMEQTIEVDRFMHDKYTNKELYNWMVSQISTIYFQSYQLAFETAKKVEKTYQFELGTDQSFIQFGYWDNLKKGLLSGEKLYYDLKRMEMAYLDHNKREYELTKHVSLAMYDPDVLLTLKETGRCNFALTEELFDLDYPGHFMRRIKSVSLTIPCVTGPYTNVNCTLTLEKSKVRKNITLVNGKYKKQVDQDQRFTEHSGVMQSITTSSAQNDSGLFELNFHDERYLPFEGEGVISDWDIKLPHELNAFNIDTISDVILHINYTAREGGEVFAEQVKEEIVTAMPKEGLLRMFTIGRDFPDAWYRFLYPTSVQEDYTVNVELTEKHFPYLFKGKPKQVDKVELFVKLKDHKPFINADADFSKLTVQSPGGNEEQIKLQSKSHHYAGLPHGEAVMQGAALGSWSLTLKQEDIATLDKSLRTTVTENDATYEQLNSEAFEDLGIMIHYTVLEER